jgi:carboxypeptidase C (cathepsin A)
MQHLPISPELERNIEYYYYPSGHMVYLNPEALKQLHYNVANFISRRDKASPPPVPACRDPVAQGR